MEIAGTVYENRLKQSEEKEMNTIVTHKTISIQGTEIHYFSNEKRDV